MSELGVRQNGPAIHHQDTVVPTAVHGQLNEALERALVVAEARTWLGTPYAPNQGCKGAGVDCAWILLRVYSSCGHLTDFEPPIYKSALARMRAGELFYRSMIQRFAVEVKRPALPGDIMLFRVPLVSRRDGTVLTRATHGAIVTEWPRIIHAYSPAGCVVESDVASSPELGHYVEAVFTMPRWIN